MQEAQPRAQLPRDRLREETTEMSCSLNSSCSDEWQQSHSSPTLATARRAGAAPWTEYGGGSETCYSPATLVLGMTVSLATSRDNDEMDCATGAMATLGQSPITAASFSGAPRFSSGTVTQIDKATIYASRKGVRSDRGAALRMLQVAIGTSPR